MNSLMLISERSLTAFATHGHVDIYLSALNVTSWVVDLMSSVDPSGRIGGLILISCSSLFSMYRSWNCSLNISR